MLGDYPEDQAVLGGFMTKRPARACCTTELAKNRVWLSQSRPQIRRIRTRQRVQQLAAFSMAARQISCWRQESQPRFSFTGYGTIAGWNPNVAVDQGAAPPSTHAVTVVKTTDGSAYTGLTSASIDGKSYLYVANFAKGRVDIYDSA